LPFVWGIELQMFINLLKMKRNIKDEGLTVSPNDGKPLVVGSASVSEDQIKEIGFKLTDSYKHDHYHTNRYKLGCLEVEFTYEKTELLTCDLTISELNCMPISFNEIKQIAELLGHWSD